MILAITSVGKWTYKYSLEKLIAQAKIIAGIPNFLLQHKRAVAKAKEAYVWPDGYEKSEGGFIIRFAYSLIWNGLNLQTIFFINILQVKNIIIRDKPQVYPYFLVFL